MKSILLLCGLLLSPLFASAANIDIDTDEDDCVKGWISMDVTVRVDNERFTFSPSCKFSFRDTFETSKGQKCEIEAGMCSNFSPRNKIEVSCGSFPESVAVDCPDKQ